VVVFHRNIQSLYEQKEEEEVLLLMDLHSVIDNDQLMNVVFVARNEI
jgi:hypothetical protein